MLKIMSVFAAAALVGAFGFCCSSTGAQDVVKTYKVDVQGRSECRPTREFELKELEAKAVEAEVLELKLQTQPAFGTVYVNANDNQPGTWTIVDTKAGTMLLNTATGASYLMKDAESEPRWVKVQNPPVPSAPRVEWKLEPHKVIPLPVRPIEDAAERLARMRAQAEELAAQAKLIRDKWAKAADRDERRKLSDELSALEDQIEVMRAEAKKLEEEARKRAADEDARKR